MMQLVEMQHINVLKQTLIETLKDVPGIYQLQEKSLTRIVGKVDEYTRKIIGDIKKLRKEVMVSRSTDNRAMLARLIGLIKQKNTFILTLHTLLRDKYLYENIFDEF